ncbi:hypothetical protein ACHAWO_008024 [Cyclotella atomus]|uniref:Prenyltransferase alpha-alpha toroid domain-containing protein n=1 Tax=Cyclotella atomus TaxID=382360 RepID=A0ABD3PC57_9STRA
MNNTTPRSQHVHTTATTIAQSETEDEVSPFFIDLSTLNEDSLDHLRSVGLLPPAKLPDDDYDDANDNNETPRRSNDHFNPLAIRLLRSAHTAYLVNALSDPLSRGFVSLDASHPWMVYWCLHSLDLLGYFDDDDEPSSGSTSGLMSDVLADVEVLQKGQLLSRIVSTLGACWTEVAVDILRDEVMGDARLRLLHHQQLEQQSAATDNTTCTVPQQDSSYTAIQAGGFGGGPQQMPHCAPTYAAVLSLSIVASLGLSKSNTHPYYKAGREALNLLSDKRLQMYAFFVSLRVDASQLYETNIVDSTAFRMQHDGEVDVRATYCLLAPAHLLGLLLDDDNVYQHGTNDDANTCTNSTNLLTTSSISRHIASCQTFEGGFGAEPHNEAHGGYTFCALAALRILNAVHTTDVQALRGWLARRQLGYEGGFCGRTNKLVDGCYSFWQGGAVAVLDGWLLEQKHTDSDSMETVDTDEQSNEILFDELLLQRYILLCAQDVKGGLRDKPSKQRDFYHSCYNLSGLSVAQHKVCHTWPCRDVDASKRNDGLNEMFGDAKFNVVGRTDPVINIRVERVQFMLGQQFHDSDSD